MSNAHPRALLAALLVAPAAARAQAPEPELLERWFAAPAPERAALLGDTAGPPLDRAGADAAARAVWTAWCARVAAGGVAAPVPPLPAATNGTPEVHDLQVGEHDMPYALLLREPGGRPAAGRPLFLCMHGGGQNASADGPHTWDVNTREWRTQIALAARVYPPDGLYLIPRIADDRLGRWRHAHHQDAYDELIEVAIATLGVDPDRVYLLGISQGGYGTDILAPHMADRFAGADAMAAGEHPHAHPPENLRHVAFRTDVGAEDTTFDRVGLARRFHTRLDELRTALPDGEVGYVHELAEQPGRGHGIDYRPGVAWIAEHRRDPWPHAVSWVRRELFGRTRPAFYWLGLDAPGERHAIRIEARLDPELRTVEVAAVEDDAPTTAEQPYPPTHALRNATLRIYLRDELCDLDGPVRVTVNGAVLHDGPVQRRLDTLLATTASRGDPRFQFPACIEIALPAD